jgi:hypothetical protein
MTLEEWNAQLAENLRQAESRAKPIAPARVRPAARIDVSRPLGPTAPRNGRDRFAYGTGRAHGEDARHHALLNKIKAHREGLLLDDSTRHVASIARILSQTNR